MCLKFTFLTNGSTPKELRGPLEGRSPPVEKHWYKADKFIFIAVRICSNYITNLITNWHIQLRISLRNWD